MTRPLEIPAVAFVSAVEALRVNYARESTPPVKGVCLGVRATLPDGILHGWAVRQSGLVVGDHPPPSRIRGVTWSAGVESAGGFVRFDSAGGPVPVGREELILVVPCLGEAWPEIVILWEPVPGKRPRA